MMKMERNNSWKIFKTHLQIYSKMGSQKISKKIKKKLLFQKQEINGNKVHKAKLIKVLSRAINQSE